MVSAQVLAGTRLVVTTVFKKEYLSIYEYIISASTGSCETNDFLHNIVILKHKASFCFNS